MTDRSSQGARRPSASVPGGARKAPSLPPCRLYLVTPAIFEPVALAVQFAAALEGSDVAALLIAPDSPEEAIQRAALDAVLPVAQPRDVAVLLADRSELAAVSAADGVHVEGGRTALETALKRLKPGKIVGAGRLRSRHDAMTAGEIGVDYVLFGRLDPGEPAPGDVLEQVAWWAELFEVPCVAVAEELAAVGPLARAGADFIALRDAVWTHPQGPVAAVRQAGAAIEIERTAT